MRRTEVRLSYVAPFDWAAALAFLRARAIDGVERVGDGVYRRTIRVGRSRGTLAIRHDQAAEALVMEMRGVGARDQEDAVARVRRLFDLDADLDAVARHLSRDPWMAPRVRAGRVPRVLRGWDGFEVAVRTIAGQQITVAGARRLNAVLVERCGIDGDGEPDGLRRLFPLPHELLAADLSRVGMPGARVAALRAVAEAAMADARLFERGASIDETVAKLRAIRGIGDWSAHYIAMRACGEPDAFPAGDVGLLRGTARPDGRRPAAAELRARAEAWRPWRAYAAHQLWAADALHPGSKTPARRPGRRAIRSQARECVPGPAVRE